MRFENPFTSIPDDDASERKRIEEEEYRNRMNLGPLWHDRKITTEVLQSRKIKLDHADMEEYSKQRETHRAMKGSEEAGFAEEVFLEGIDIGGKTRAEEYQPYAWFGNRVVAYPAHPHDDVLRGADAVLMFIDPENERVGHPVAVDITTDRLAYDKKFGRDLSRIRGRGLSSVYWAETAGGPGEYFDTPGEGRLKALNLSVYLPKEAVAKFINPSVTNAEADRVMQRLAPFVRRQIQSELEAQAMLLLGLHSREVRSLSQKGLLAMLEAPMSGERSSSFDEARQILMRTLPSVWEVVNSSEELPQSREQVLPESIQERPPLRADLETKNRVAS